MLLVYACLVLHSPVENVIPSQQKIKQIIEEQEEQKLVREAVKQLVPKELYKEETEKLLQNMRKAYPELPKTFEKEVMDKLNKNYASDICDVLGACIKNRLTKTEIEWIATKGVSGQKPKTAALLQLTDKVSLIGKWHRSQIVERAAAESRRLKLKEKTDK